MDNKETISYILSFAQEMPKATTLKCGCTVYPAKAMGTDQSFIQFCSEHVSLLEPDPDPIYYVYKVSDVFGNDRYFRTLEQALQLVNAVPTLLLYRLGFKNVEKALVYLFNETSNQIIQTEDGAVSTMDLFVDGKFEVVYHWE